MANNYRVVRVVENIIELEAEVSKLLIQGWKLAGGITVTLAVGGRLHWSCTNISVLAGHDLGGIAGAIDFI
jgi:hypothetical protein